MIRLVSYLIIRAFTSIWLGMALLFAPALYAANVSDIPAFYDAQGQSTSLQDFKGKAVLLNLWASWCAPCVAEMPGLASIQEEYKDKGLVVLALSEDETIADVVKFYKTKSITTLAPFLDKNHAVWMSFKARGLPTTILIDKNGNRVKTIEGFLGESPDFKKELDGLISIP